MDDYTQDEVSMFDRHERLTANKIGAIAAAMPSDEQGQVDYLIVQFAANQALPAPRNESEFYSAPCACKVGNAIVLGLALRGVVTRDGGKTWGKKNGPQL